MFQFETLLSLFVQVKNLALPAGQQCRPYMTLRVGSQHGQTRVAEKGGRGRASNSWAWHQSFDAVVRRRPRAEDLEDLLTLRLLSYSIAFKDLELGRSDVSVVTLGDPFRPPDVGAVFLKADPTAPGPTGLDRRAEQDFWIPLSFTSQQVPLCPHSIPMILR